MKWFLFLFLIISFHGCDIFETKEQAQQKLIEERLRFEKQAEISKEIEIKKLAEETQRELAVLDSKKELAKIEKTKELEKIRLDAELQKQRIIFEQEEAKREFEYKIKSFEHNDMLEIKRYTFLLIFFSILIVSFFIFYFFKKRHEDKLRAYNDNLEKYFHQKENDSKVKIANKMLDTIAQGNLTKEQEMSIINAFSGTINKNEIEYKDVNLIEDLETLEEKETVLIK